MGFAPLFTACAIPFATSNVLVVGLGRLGDIVGRVRIYNLGFVIYTVASLLLTIDWMTGAELREAIPPYFYGEHLGRILFGHLSAQEAA